LRNEGGNANHWLGLTLIGSCGPVSAIGAKVTVKAGDMQQVKQNQWATTYLSSNDPRLHFGLGQNIVIDTMEIRWPDGRKEYFRELPVDHYMTVIEGRGIQKK
jgi:hypothetical protein